MNARVIEMKSARTRAETTELERVNWLDKRTTAWVVESTVVDQNAPKSWKNSL